MPFISEGQTLLLVLVLLYLSECVIWMKRQSVAFIAASGGRGRIAFPHSWLGNANGGILFLNPLPPAGKVFLSHLTPISISPSGICAFNLQTLSSGARSASQTGRFLSFSKVKQTGIDGPYLLMNKEKFVKCATAGQARKLSKLIDTMVKASPAKREALAKSWVAKQFAVKEAATRLREGKKAINLIQTMGWSLFLFLFALAPILVTMAGLLQVLIMIAIVMLVAAISIAVLFSRAHKKLYPEEKSERLESLVKMILCPPASIRAADILTRNMLAEFSPIVLADLLTGNRGRQFVRAFVLDLQYPLKHEVLEESARSTINWAAAEQLKASLAYLNSGRFENAEALLAPAEREGNSLSYCPRCGCQFVVHSVDCTDCPGVELVAFSKQIGVETGGSASQPIRHG